MFAPRHQVKFLVRVILMDLLITCRQVEGDELLSAQHGHGGRGETPQDVHVGRQVQDAVVAEGGEKHGGIKAL